MSKKKPKKAAPSKPAKKAAPKKAAPKARKPAKVARGRESRPRVQMIGETMVFRPYSPYKGRITKANPGPRVLVDPLRVELSASEAAVMEGSFPPSWLLEQIIAGASSRRGWDHLEVYGPRGTHLFNLVF
jgi:hypothetical protein